MASPDVKPTPRPTPPPIKPVPLTVFIPENRGRHGTGAKRVQGASDRGSA